MDHVTPWIDYLQSLPNYMDIPDAPGGETPWKTK